MNYTNKTLALLVFFLTSFYVDLAAANKNIKHIFIDINAIIVPSQTAASKIIGIINSMKYTAIVGAIPSRADFFKALKNVPALTHQQTYNEDLVMPPILCDWLLGLQTNHAIRAGINQYLDQSSMQNIEKTIFKNITAMMMSPSTFIDTQYILKDITKILHTLKKAGYTIYLIGNWDKESEPHLMKLCNGHFLPDARHCYFSHKAKQLKPNADYFHQLLEHFKVAKKECLMIEVEKLHAQKARIEGFSTILLYGNSAIQLKSELIRMGINF